MDKTKLEGLDDFLSKVDRVHQQIQDMAANKIDVDEVDAEILKEQEEERKAEERRKRKEAEAWEKKKQGRPGKGHQENYISFCKHCFVEYTIRLPVCTHCGKNTIDMEERRAELLKKAEAYKSIKAERAERKRKWEKWQKTEAMFWKKTTTNYSKWDYFTDESEEEPETEPIVPKDDPNFKAMEKDAEERAKRREQGKKKATELKTRGNEYMAKKDYENAIKCYTEGIENSKDFKELYTNRALAHIKINKFKEAIDDCTRMLDFIEVFEDGFTKSAPNCIKGFLRRAQAYKELGQYEEALQDIEQVFKLSPKDKDAQKVKDEIEFIKQHKAKAEEIEKKMETSDSTAENSGKEESKKTETTQQDSKDITATFTKEEVKEKIQKFLSAEKPDKETIEALTKIFRSSEEMRVYAHKQKIIQKFIAVLQNPPYDISVYFLLVVFSKENSIYQTEFLKLGGAKILYDQIRALSEQLTLDDASESLTKDAKVCEELEEILEIFVNFAEVETSRDYLKTYDFFLTLPDLLYDKLIKLLKLDKGTLSSLIGLISSLAAISKDMSNYIRDKYMLQIINDSSKLILTTSKASYLRLKENIYGLMANLLKDEAVRTKFYTGGEEYTKFLKLVLINMHTMTIANPSNLRWINSVELVLAIFVNLAYNITDEARRELYVNKLDLFKYLRRFFGLSKDRQLLERVVSRTVQVLSKVDFQEHYLKDTRNDIMLSFKQHLDAKARSMGVANHALRLYIKWLEKSHAEAWRKYFKAEDFADLIANLKEMFKEDDLERFSNGCLLGGNLVDSFPELCIQFKGEIKRLLDVVREKTGPDRKSAAIFVAKLSKNEENLNVIRENHGIEILASVNNVILKK